MYNFTDGSFTALMVTCAGLDDRIALDTKRGLGANLRCVLAAVCCAGDTEAAAAAKKLGYMEALVRLLQQEPGPGLEDRELGLRMREVRTVRIMIIRGVFT